MKKIYFLFSALFITSLSFGQTIITENFDYGGSAGDLVTQSGTVWAAHSGGAPEVGYATTSLTMASYPSSGVVHFMDAYMPKMMVLAKFYLVLERVLLVQHQLYMEQRLTI